ncbi:hypothetical protein GF325_13970 [Candidatus Bathyarchaeota archaeon]|nr:hypothetical protein [Candidatus Bathyarchaeota archaeon]
MPFKKSKKVKKEILAQFGTKTSLPGLLNRLGLSMFLLLFGILILVFFMNSTAKMPFLDVKIRDFSLLFLIVGFAFFCVFLGRLRRYNRRKRAEERKKPVNWNDLWKPIVVIIVLNAVMLYGLFGFLPAIGLSGSNTLAACYAFALAFFVSSLPIIMALWYKGAPSIAVKLIMRLHIALTDLYRYFHKEDVKPKIHKILVTDTPQGSSLYMMVKRSFTGMTFSIFFVSFLITNYFPPLGFVNWFLEYVLGVPGEKVGSIGEIVFKDMMGNVTNAFMAYCTYFVIVSIIPLVLSYLFWFWVLPPTWLMDDAGVVYFRKTLKRRRPPVMKSIGSWFLSIVKPLVGGSAVFGYVFYIANNAPILDTFIANEQYLRLSQFSIIVYAFPILTTMITVFILLLFQETQFNVLKTHLFQNMVNMKIDPRLTKLHLVREDELLPNTLRHLYGEGMKPNPPLDETVDYFTEIGELDFSDNVLPFSDVNFDAEELKKQAKQDLKRQREDDVIEVK